MASKHYAPTKIDEHANTTRTADQGAELGDGQENTSPTFPPPYKLKNVTVVDGVLKASNLHFQNVSSWDCYGLIFFGWKKKNLLYFLKTKQKTHDSDTESCVSIELGFGSEGICKFT